jgi:antirestriction protein ArdC
MLSYSPVNAITGIPYSGKNIDRLEGKFESPEWATFIQWRSKGYKVKKGEKGTRCVTYGDTLDVKEGKIKTYVKGFTVFNKEQVEIIK